MIMYMLMMIVTIFCGIICFLFVGLMEGVSFFILAQLMEINCNIRRGNDVKKP